MGDHDNDGTPSPLIATWGADPAGRTDRGIIWVCDPAGPGTTVDMTTPGAVCPTEIWGAAGALWRIGSTLVRSTAAVDLDADGAPDLVAGSQSGWHNGTEAGNLFVVRGPVGPGVIDLGPDGDLKMYGPGGDWSTGERQRLGAEVCATDLDGDGFVEVISGSPWPRYSGRDQLGRLWVLRSPGTVLPVAGIVNLAGGNPSWVEVIEPDLPSVPDLYRLGTQIACGDTDGDGVAEVWASAWDGPTARFHRFEALVTTSP